MFLTAAKCLAGQVADTDLNKGCIYPCLKNIRDVPLNIATAVAQLAYTRDLADLPRPGDLRTHIGSQVYNSTYEIYV